MCIRDRYNWFGTLQNGFMNSLVGKKGCKRVTTYETDDNDENDDVPVSDSVSYTHLDVYKRQP